MGYLTSDKTPKKIDGELWVMADIGNNDIKFMLHGDFGNEVWFSHAIRVVRPIEYGGIRAKSTRHDICANGTAIFEVLKKDTDGNIINEQGYVVGFEAVSATDKKRIVGSGKYVEGHFNVLFLAAMLHLYPTNHKNIHVIVVHPTDVTEENIESIQNLLGGKHIIRLPNDEIVTYGVREVITLPEPVAALNTSILTEDGKPYPEVRDIIKPNTKIFTADIGGALSQFCECRITSKGEIIPDVNNALVLPVGIQNVIPAFVNELKCSNRPEFSVFKNMQQIPIELIEAALMNLSITIRTETYECVNEVRQAMKHIADPVRAVYENRYALGVAHARIIMSGGGGGICKEYFERFVFEHNAVCTAEAVLDKMRFDKVRGASKGLKALELSGQKKSGGR